MNAAFRAPDVRRADPVVFPQQGNSSAASIPLALSVADGQGRFREGDVIVTEAIGGGLSWGSVVLRW